jgi:hypothetical protein
MKVTSAQVLIKSPKKCGLKQTLSLEGFKQVHKSETVRSVPSAYKELDKEFKKVQSQVDTKPWWFQASA